ILQRRLSQVFLLQFHLERERTEVRKQKTEFRINLRDLTCPLFASLRDLPLQGNREKLARRAGGHGVAEMLAKAVRCWRTVSICPCFKRAKRGRFAYFGLRLALQRWQSLYDVGEPSRFPRV